MAPPFLLLLLLVGIVGAQDNYDTPDLVPRRHHEKRQEQQQSKSSTQSCAGLQANPHKSPPANENSAKTTAKAFATST
jgi:hypothetical protein